jgi:hypothetical protein
MLMGKHIANVYIEVIQFSLKQLRGYSMSPGKWQKAIYNPLANFQRFWYHLHMNGQLFCDTSKEIKNIQSSRSNCQL